jgi:hypothetical protein
MQILPQASKYCLKNAQTNFLRGNSTTPVESLVKRIFYAVIRKRAAASSSNWRRLGRAFGIGQGLAESAGAGQAGHDAQHVAGDGIELQAERAVLGQLG